MALAIHSRFVASGARARLAETGSRVRVCGRFATYASTGRTLEQTPAMPRRAAVMLSLGLPALLGLTSPAHASYLDLDDSRNTGAKEAMESADQARDDNLDERRRFSFESVGKLSKDEHQQRAKESYSRLQRDVKFYLDKNLLNRVSNELGLQIGSLRYDLEQIAAQGDKASRKAAQSQSKQAIKALERLDLYARLKKPTEANEAYSDALAKLGNIVKAYG